jgi:hypothetical protein
VQVLRDPGWMLKWVGCLMICYGIFTMFYLRPYFSRTDEPAIKKRGAKKAAPAAIGWYDHPLAIFAGLLVFLPLGLFLLVRSRAIQNHIKIIMLFGVFIAVVLLVFGVLY